MFFDGSAVGSHHEVRAGHRWHHPQAIAAMSTRGSEGVPPATCTCPAGLMNGRIAQLVVVLSLIPNPQGWLSTTDHQQLEGLIIDYGRL